MSSTRRLPDSSKNLCIPTSAIENGESLPLTQDGHIAYDLHAAGLRCEYGSLVFNRDSIDPIPEILSQREFRHAVDKYGARQVPVFLGPSAQLLDDNLFVFSSDAVSTSLGLWVPRPGLNVNLVEIDYVRLA